jgi:branched-chain amino acid transport system substrate-binding protein
MRAEELGLGNMAQLAWKNDAGESMIAAADPFWEKAGKSIVATEYMEIGAANIDTQVAKIRVSNPDWVALWTFSPETGLALKKLREFGVKVPLIGVEYTGDVKELAGASAEGYEYATDFFAPSAENPWSEQFAKAYRERYGEEPEFYAANYYENVYVLAEAIRRARAEGGAYWNGRKLAEVIRKSPTFPSVYAKEMTYQDNNVALKQVGVFRIENGEPTFQKFIDLNH